MRRAKPTARNLWLHTTDALEPPDLRPTAKQTSGPCPWPCRSLGPDRRNRSNGWLVTFWSWPPLFRVLKGNCKENRNPLCVPTFIYIYPPTPLPARGRRWGSVRLALERDCGSLLPSLSPSPVQPCTLPAFFLSVFSCSSSFLFFPFPFCCRRTPLVGARCKQTSAAWKSAGSKAFVAGRSLWTDSLAAYWTQTRR